LLVQVCFDRADEFRDLLVVVEVNLAGDGERLEQLLALLVSDDDARLDPGAAGLIDELLREPRLGYPCEVVL
jgi:hypothetical protein